MAVPSHNDVLVARGEIVTVSHDDVRTIQACAEQSARRRARLCAHQDVNDLLHEMFIVLRRSGYVRPHKHLSKCESFHLIEGEIDVVVFHDDGTIRQWLRLGDARSEHPFYFRLSAPYFHTVLCNTETAVVHEVTTGPFRKEDTIPAAWAPPEDDPIAASVFVETLRRQQDTFLKR